MACKNHPDKEAEFECESCKGLLCHACVTTRTVTTDFTAYICKSCGGKCELLVQQKKARRSAKQRTPIFKREKISPAPVSTLPAGQRTRVTFVQPSFFKSIIPALFFPFAGTGMIKMVLCAAGLFLAVYFPLPYSTNLLAAIILLTYGAVYAFRIMYDTYEGRNRLPPLHDKDSWDYAGRRMALLAGALVICLGPAHVYALLRGPFDTVFFALLGVGMVCLPMFIIRITVIRNIRALNIIGLFLGITRTLFSYVGLLSALAIVTAAFFYAHNDIISEYGFKGSLGGCLAAVYALFVHIRLLGVFARANKRTLFGVPA